MKEPQKDIIFKSLNAGVGFSSTLMDSSFSYYEKKEGDLNQLNIFDKLSQSPDFYDELTKRLEEPLLDSLEENRTYKNNFTPSKQIVEKVKPVFKRSLETYSEIHSPLSFNCLPPLEALKTDFIFTLGLFMLGGVLAGVLFEFYQIPSLFLTLFSYGVFYQIYTACMRTFMGSTFGEERCNIGWNTKSPLRFVARSCLFILTGFVFIYLFSIVFKRDLFEDYTDLKLQYRN